MKNITTSIVVALTLGVCAFATSSAIAETADPKAEKAGNFYRQGITAMNAGKYEIAKTSFREVLKIYPSHPQAKRKLLYLNANRKTLEVGQRKNALGKVVIPKVDIDKASVQESIEILMAHVKSASSDKKSPNMIVNDPKGGFTGKTVTLNLTNIPASTLLQYILDQSGGVARFDNHAIVIRPRK